MDHRNFVVFQRKENSNGKKMALKVKWSIQVRCNIVGTLIFDAYACAGEENGKFFKIIFNSL